MTNVKDLKIEKKFNHTLQENVYILSGTINGKDQVIGSYEKRKEAFTAKRAIETVVILAEDTKEIEEPQEKTVELLALEDNEKEKMVSKTIRLVNDVHGSSNEKILNAGEIGTLESIDLYYRIATVKVNKKKYDLFFYNVEVIL